MVVAYMLCTVGEQFYTNFALKSVEYDVTVMSHSPIGQPMPGAFLHTGWP